MNKGDALVVVAARRSPQGRFLGKLSSYSALDLGEHVAKSLLEEIPSDQVDLTIMGNVLPPAINIGRQIALKSGVPKESPAYTVNMVCASGLQAVTLACDAVRLGHASVVLCGGAESMSQAPHLLNRSRQGFRLGDARLTDSLLLGLSDPLLGESMTQTAQRLADEGGITREDQDRFACASHRKAVSAAEDGIFAREMVAFPELDHDEHPRADTSLEKLAGLKTVLGGDSSVTAGNASGINDAAALLVVCNAATAQKNGWKPLAKISAYTSAGCDPSRMGLGPVFAVRKLCKQTGARLGDFDAIEINEAFAAQALACSRQLGVEEGDPRLNPNGGAVALGHPIGASGARLAVHLAHRIAAGEIRKGLASLCVGGGMGIAAVFQSTEADD